MGGQRRHVDLVIADRPELPQPDVAGPGRRQLRRCKEVRIDDGVDRRIGDLVDERPVWVDQHHVVGPGERLDQVPSPRFPVRGAPRCGDRSTRIWRRAGRSSVAPIVNRVYASRSAGPRRLRRGKVGSGPMAQLDRPPSGRCQRRADRGASNRPSRREPPEPPAIDLRSDVLSPPTPEMFEAMAAARIGWTLRSEDASVTRLERLGAAMLGTEAALFVPNVDDGEPARAPRRARRAERRCCSTASPTSTSSSGTPSRWAVSSPERCRQTAAISPWTKWRRPSPMAPVAGRPRSACSCSRTRTRSRVALRSRRTRPDRLAAAAHASGALVHLDGARLFDAAVALGVPPTR